MAVMTSLAERIDILESSEAGKEVWRISRRLGWRPSTIRKWRNRGRKLGRAGLVSHMGRPAKGALSSFSQELRDTLLRWRQEHPGWGPKTLRKELEKHPAFAGKELPAPSSIGRFLAEKGLSKRYERHQALPKEAKPEGLPHEVWEMDAQGYQFIPDVGQVSLINFNDRGSHLRLLSYPCWLGHKRVERHAQTSDYQMALRLAFTDWGLPQALQVDHESVFYDNKSKSPFPTQLHLWLIALGVSLRFGRHGQPTDQGMTERSHQLWDNQVIQGATFTDWQALYDALYQRRDFLNSILPCASLDNQPPLAAYPQANHSGHPYRLEWEAELLDLKRIDVYLGQGRWFRRVGSNGVISLGGTMYYVSTKWKQQQIEIKFDPDIRQFQCFDATAELLKTFPLKGVSVESLMGDVFPLCHFPVFQLALPFSWEEQKVIRLYEIAK
ncbi:MAG TPA: transposase [Chromatiaceae bacterium]|nr:transposase [Chromatiaceae bacterium]